MFRELKEYMKGVKKYMFERNRNISKEIKCLKRNQKKNEQMTPRTHMEVQQGCRILDKYNI